MKDGSAELYQSIVVFMQVPRGGVIEQCREIDQVDLPLVPANRPCYILSPVYMAPRMGNAHRRMNTRLVDNSPMRKRNEDDGIPEIQIPEPCCCNIKSNS